MLPKFENVRGCWIARELFAVPPQAQATEAPAGYALALRLKIGTLYEFKRAGDRIAAHTHEAGAGHFSLVLSGLIAYVAEGVGELELSSHALFWVAEGIEHSFVARAPGSLLLNLRGASFDLSSVRARARTAAVELSGLERQVLTLKCELAALGAGEAP
jgi:hypothetical protein